MVGLFSEETLNHYNNEERLKVEFFKLKSLSAVHKATVREALDGLQTVFITVRTDESYDGISDEVGRVLRKTYRALVVLPSGSVRYWLMAASRTLTDISLLRAVREGRIDPAKDPKFDKELRNMTLRYKLETWPVSKRGEKVLEIGLKCIEEADKSASLVGI